MPGFMYFLPRPKDTVMRDGRLSVGVLTECGLADVLADVSAVPKECVVCEVRRGPEGQAGTLLLPVPNHQDLSGKLGYDQLSQQWLPREAYWIGWVRDSVPRPIDLERRNQIPGWEIRDAYADSWSIPVARSPNNRRGNFPFAVEWDAAGRPSCTVSGRYAALWRDSARLWDLVAQHAQPARGGLAIIGEGFTDQDDQFVIDMVTRALAVNYRVDPLTLAAYDQFRPGWLTQVAASLMANALVDMHAKRAWEAAQKKTATPSELAGVSSTPGDLDETTSTAPAAEN